MNEVSGPKFRVLAQQIAGQLDICPLDRPHVGQTALRQGERVREVGLCLPGAHVDVDQLLEHLRGGHEPLGTLQRSSDELPRFVA